MKAIVAGLGVLMAASSMAQTRSSFLTVDVISDVVVTVTNGGLNNLVSLGANPTFVYQSNLYHITDVFGFWDLSNDDDLVATGNDFGLWQFHENQADGGGIAGWKTNPNTGLTPNTSDNFNFLTLNYSSVEQVGFHVRTVEEFPFGGFTAYVTVPEPASLIALGAGVAALVARRRRKA